MKKKTIEVHPFRSKLLVVLDTDLKWIEKKYKTKPLDDFGAVTLKDETKYRHYVVAFECRNRSLIAHEIVHIINYIYLDHGVELDRVNDENQAYLTAWLFEEIENFIYS